MGNSGEISIKIRFFIHPIPLGAVALMAVNDHWLKYRFPGSLTGKLSDFCGVFYLPIFLLALATLANGLLQPPKYRLGPKSALTAILFTDFLLVLVKLSAPNARLLESFFAEYLFAIQIIQDPTDLIALLMNPFTYWYLRSYWSSSKVT